ncbi:MAG: DUF4301 family protein [Candidatus Tectomicrobia bacterium]|uniref:DUF4301 family protein n=1 Tax=Tectimicrobiota bacterium TaxID=2528274 RepID=A0A937W0S6_UNCTE|nr:DUF4301 family protein [Candidatus Tectomicrobia bacterium]
MTPTLFTEADIQQMTARGHTLKTVRAQIALFEQGMPYTTLHRPCTVGDGITVLEPHEFTTLDTLYRQAVAAGRVTKFVPASGAATRMFQTLLAVYEHPGAVTAHQAQEMEHFAAHLPQFAFYEALQACLRQQGHHLNARLTPAHYPTVLGGLLTPAGLNYAHLPKALLHFHRYRDHCRTPLEEHLVEATAYAQDQQQVTRLHLTVTPAHIEAMQAHLAAVRPRYEHAGTCFDITLSVQSPATDTIAVDLHNRPFRDAQGRLLFRPAGHGALLANLQVLQADIVFLNNIDNVVPDHLKATTYCYKRALGGYLVAVQRQLFTYLERLETGQADDALLAEIRTFAQQQLAITLPPGFSDRPQAAQIPVLMERLNRPMRVCGMVRNVGEPGGGPFWVQHADGSLSRQIVETSQVDASSPAQRAILAAATHFNPVDLVCGVRDYRGRPFDLQQFADPHTGFIAEKTSAGRPLKAMELPGLWNGAMARWNTLFVEVPLETFNPVKTVLDLLRPAHQP